MYFLIFSLIGLIDAIVSEDKFRSIAISSISLSSKMIAGLVSVPIGSDSRGLQTSEHSTTTTKCKHCWMFKMPTSPKISRSEISRSSSGLVKAEPTQIQKKLENSHTSYTMNTYCALVPSNCSCQSWGTIIRKLAKVVWKWRSSTSHIRPKLDDRIPLGSSTLGLYRSRCAWVWLAPNCWLAPLINQ